VDLEAARSNVNALQRENERITETCRQITLRAKSYHREASQANAVIKEMSRAFESAKAKEGRDTIRDSRNHPGASWRKMSVRLPNILFAVEIL
jgi:hypothetical protein